MERQIILNQIRTPDGTIMRSFHVHDYRTHTDQNGLVYMVDGGNDYARRNVHESYPYKELSVYSDAPFEEIRKALHRGGRGKDGKNEYHTWVPLDEMSDEWIKACIEYNKNNEAFATQMYRKELEYRKQNNITINENN